MSTEIRLSKINTIGDGSCFFHSLFTAFPKYRALSENGKKQYVYKFRKAIAKKLTYEDFCSLSIFESMTQHTTDKIPVYEEFTQRLSHPHEWACHYIISYTAYILDINIIVLDDRNRIILNEDKANHLPKIFMLLVNDSHFVLLANQDENKYIF